MVTFAGLFDVEVCVVLYVCSGAVGKVKSSPHVINPVLTTHRVIFA